jgi:phosphomannomutase
MTTPTLESLRARALAWAAEDPDPETAAACRALAETADLATLTEHFGTRLEFGTAGLRGALGPGPNRMNQALVRRVTAGLADYLLTHVPTARSAGVAIGFDGRIGSREFAAEAACVLAGRGIPSFLYDDVCPTPQLAHAVVFTGAVAGIMVTASHNPPQDNGYKVYWGNGAQIVPPHDHGISAAVDAVAGLETLRLPSLAVARAEGLVRAVPEAALADYLHQVAALRVHRETGLRIVYTAMHGVGRRLIEQVLRPGGAHGPAPGGRTGRSRRSFPHRQVPQPRGARRPRPALALAAKVGADLVLANDPGRRPPGGRRTPRGWHLAAALGQRGRLPARRGSVDARGAGGQSPGGHDGRVVGPALAHRRQAHGAAYAETLTGFKWIANAALRTRPAAGGSWWATKRRWVQRRSGGARQGRRERGAAALRPRGL